MPEITFDRLIYGRQSQTRRSEREKTKRLTRPKRSIDNASHIWQNRCQTANTETKRRNTQEDDVNTRNLRNSSFFSVLRPFAHLSLSVRVDRADCCFNVRHLKAFVDDLVLVFSLYFSILSSVQRLHAQRPYTIETCEYKKFACELC